MSEASQETNWLDRLIGFFSPEKAYKRMAYRQAYSAGESHRRQDGWMPIEGSAERLNAMSRETVRRKARDLERNSDIMNSLLEAFERNVVGSGFVPQADTGDEELNNRIEHIFREWSNPKNCDISGTQSFNEMCNMIVRRLKIDGGILLLKTYGGNESYPFQLQAREVSDLDGDSVVSYQHNGKSVVGGIEVNDYGKPLAYWIKQETPDGWSTLETKRIPADKVIALWEKKRPSQIREMSPMSQAITRIADAEDYLDTISLKEKILACFGIFIKRAMPSGGVGRGLNKIDVHTGLPRKTVTPGMIQELNPGDEAQAVVPAGQASNAKDMLAIMIRLIGSGMGLSYEAISRDMSQVNYSSARQGLLEDKRTYERIQRYLIDHFLDTVYEEVVISAVTARTLVIPDFWSYKGRYLKHSWNTPGWDWIDPEKEANANKIALESNQETMATICARSGMDWKEVLGQRAIELAYIKKLEAAYGISLQEGGSAVNGTAKTEKSSTAE